MHMIKHFTPSAEVAGCSDVEIVGIVGQPLPKWIIPLQLIMRIVVGVFSKTFKTFNEKVLDRWTELGYVDRIASLSDLYEAVEDIESVCMKPTLSKRRRHLTVHSVS